MSLSVSKRMAAIRSSPTGAVLALAAELRAAGRDIISLGAGEPDFDTPEHIKQAACKAIADGDTKYTPIDGSAELKAAIAQKFARENQLTYETSQIIVSGGAKQCLFNLCLGLLSPGDETIIPAPYWVSYPDMVRLAGAEPVVVAAGIDENFKITPAQLRAAITPKTRLFILNSPSNPTGACYTRAEMQALGAVLAEHQNIVIAADDIYEHIHWAHEPFCSFAAACPELFDRTVTINGVSKAYAMTGWRIGYAAGPKALITAMKTIQSQSTSNACSISQAAAVAALSGDQAAVAAMAAAYKERHDYIVGALNDIGGFECRPGEGTFYAFPRVDAALGRMQLASDTDLVKRLINVADVACVPGSAFGAPGYVRMSFACSLDTLREATDRIKRAVAT
ncbi:MAG: pyridoxal phosphate-dependent aminotransferase [Gammaproteobacteria bacterium]|nr:pyridoxal phosphate-dependent aminotransferase [Gammaproteobacteria bacterium]